MAQIDRQQTVLSILQNLSDLEGLKKLFWQELNYERENRPLSPRQWPESARQPLAEDPILFAGGGEDNAFHVIYCRLESDILLRGHERPVVNCLTREHPYALFVFSNKDRNDWHFLNVKYYEEAEKRRLLRRITVRPGEGLRTAAERLQMLDLESIGGTRSVASVSPLEIQSVHDAAFDVEKVTKDFYREIATWYFWARECAEFPRNAQTDADGKPSLPLIRLLTRLIFCWFLKEKRNPQAGTGLIPDSLFDPRRIRGLLNDPSPGACSYYTAILQNLFFATLNTEMDPAGGPRSRRWVEEGDGQRSDDHMVHTVWRHARQLRDPAALEKLLRDIPFLNGGLFECLDDRVRKGNSTYTEEVRIDGFTTDPKKQPKLPNFLFYGIPQEADLSEAYTGRRRETVRPILDILNRHNFTLTENTPFDQEVALDPELLGHVFENLLAAYNPETGTVARKATGSFYTPRVVVDWMVDQALLVYFKTVLKCGGSTPLPDMKRSHSINFQSANSKETEKKLKRLLSWEEEGNDFQPDEIEKLIDAIDGLKAIDPACGSGAFPMGLLQKLVHVLQKLDPDNQGWRRRQENAVRTIESSTAREEALKAIEYAFARDNDDYGRKLFLIENCLYGVDIQPIAVQIAKLRFFVSLMVDQSIKPNEENYGILPLPNLETKVVAANTILGLHRGQLLLGSNEVKRLESELQKIRHNYFTARSYKRKKELRKEDKRLCEELAKELETSGECTPYDAKRLADWNPYDASKPAPFFDPGWMFGVTPKKDGGVFDLVIGNPPYVRHEELRNETVIGSDGEEKPLKGALKGQYECFAGTADLYVYFFERSLQILRTGGVLSFITSNKYFRAAYGEKVRTYLRWATKPSVILDFGDAPVFTSIAYPAILVTQKTRQVEKNQLPSSRKSAGILHSSRKPPKDWQSRVMTWTPGPDIRDFPDIFDSNAFTLALSDLKPDGWRMENPISLHLLERLRNAGTPLGVYVNGRLYSGVKAGFSEAFVVDRATRDRLIAEHKSSAEVLKPFLRGRDVKRWRCEFADQYLIKIESSENKTHPWSEKSGREAERIFAEIYPAIHVRLNTMRDALIKRYDQGRFFWELRSCDYWREFEQPKIVFPDIAPSAQFAWDDQSHFLANTSYVLMAPLWALSVLNSTAILCFYRKISNAIRGGYLRYIRQYVVQIPIPSATSVQQTLCERLVDGLIWLHSPSGKNAKDASTGLMITHLEQWLNGLVYELFFTDELHSRKLKLFDETAKLNPPELPKLSAKDKLSALQELHNKACAKNVALQSMLFELKSLDVVRVIEDVGKQAGN